MGKALSGELSCTRTSHVRMVSSSKNPNRKSRKLFPFVKNGEKKNRDVLTQKTCIGRTELMHIRQACDNNPENSFGSYKIVYCGHS